MARNPFTSHNWLVHHRTETELRRVFPLYLKGRLIDVGCGRKPYEEFAKPYVTEHLGVDETRSLHGTSRVDVLGSAYALPFEDESFDSALCSSVLEHLEEPERGLRECHRVLRPGAHAIFTIPFLWHLHEKPRDFFRLTKYGISHLFPKMGFELLEVVPLSGFWMSFGQMLTYVLHRHDRGWLRSTRILASTATAIQLVSWAADRIDPQDDWTCAYLIVARKPESFTSHQAQAS